MVGATPPDLPRDVYHRKLHIHVGPPAWARARERVAVDKRDAKLPTGNPINATRR